MTVTAEAGQRREGTMKGWKLGAAALAISTAITGCAWAQNQTALGESPARSSGQYSLLQTSWQDHDRDRDDNGQWRNGRRDQDRRDRDDRDPADRQDHDRGWHNNGWYGRRNDNDRDDVYRNGGYRAYPGGVYGYGGYGQPVNGRGAYGRGGYNNIAAQTGYQDGFSYGRNDAARGKGYNASGSEAYENADRGYNSSFGDRSSYRQEYRQAYQQGYGTGYNGAGYGAGYNGGYARR